MSSPDAYQDEMGRFLRLSDEDLSRLLAGEAGVRDESLDEVAALLTDVRTAFVSSAPNETTRSHHIAMISEASQFHADRRPASQPARLPASGLTLRRAVKKAMNYALLAAAVSVMASGSMIGLAYAGVDLPGEAAAKAVEAVTGIQLPNQDSDGKSVSDTAHEIKENSGLEGCELGQAIADAADANRQNEATPERSPCDEGEAGQARGQENSAEGKAKAAENSAAGKAKAAQNRAKADEKSAEGRAKAPEKSGGRSDAGADNAGTNDDAGRARGDEASGSNGRPDDPGAHGRGNNPDE